MLYHVHTQLRNFSTFLHSQDSDENEWETARINSQVILSNFMLT